MPTILINTNLNSRKNDKNHSNDSDAIQYSNDDLDDEFRQDINMIISKLLNKSKTLDSFTIKYDIEDINVNQKQNDSLNDLNQNLSIKTNCICNKMARLFNDLLHPASNTSTSCSDEHKNGSQNDLRHIYKEIKLLRKYQFDLNNKFNLLIDKLDTQTSSLSSQNSTNSTTKPSPSLTNTKAIKQEPKVQLNLTGAKKRKFNSFKSFSSQTAQDPPRSASVTSSSSTDSSTSSHTSTSTEIQVQDTNETNENESLILMNENQDDSNGELAELDDEQAYVDQEDVPDDEFDNYEEQKNFKFPILYQQNPRFHNFKHPQTFNSNYLPIHPVPHNVQTPQKNVLNTGLNQSYDLDLNELFKGNGPKYLQLESYKNFKPPIVFLNEKYYVDDTMAALSYSKSKSRRNFAAHLTKLVFTPRERLESNCNGRFGKKALDSVRLLAIRNTIFKYYPCKQSTVILNGDKITSGDYDENSVWVRDCIPAIDESNRVLKKQLVAWYKKNNPSILIRHNNGASASANNTSQSQMNSQGLSPSTSASMSYSTNYYHSSNIDECNENFDDVDDC